MAPLQGLRETRDMAINYHEINKKELRPSPSEYKPENFENGAKKRKAGKKYKFE